MTQEGQGEKFNGWQMLKCNTGYTRTHKYIVNTHTQINKRIHNETTAVTTTVVL